MWLLAVSVIACGASKGGSPGGGAAGSEVAGASAGAPVPSPSLPPPGAATSRDASVTKAEPPAPARTDAAALVQTPRDAAPAAGDAAVEHYRAPLDALSAGDVRLSKNGRYLMCAPEPYPKEGAVCVHWCGGEVPYPGGIDALPNCPVNRGGGVGPLDEVKTCEQWCGCWFGKGVTNPWSGKMDGWCGSYNPSPTDNRGLATAGIFRTAGECLAMCRTELGEPITHNEAYWLLVANFHCDEGVPPGLCQKGSLIGSP